MCGMGCVVYVCGRGSHWTQLGHGLACLSVELCECVFVSMARWGVSCQREKPPAATPRQLLRDKKKIRHPPQQQHAANARRVREREHRADAHKGPRRVAARGLRIRAHGSPNGSKQTSRRLQSVQHRSPSRSRCRRRRSPPRPRATRRRPTNASSSPTTRSAAAYRSGC